MISAFEVLSFARYTGFNYLVRSLPTLTDGALCCCRLRRLKSNCNVDCNLSATLNRTVQLSTRLDPIGYPTADGVDQLTSGPILLPRVTRMVSLRSRIRMPLWLISGLMKA